MNDGRAGTGAGGSRFAERAAAVLPGLGHLATGRTGIGLALVTAWLAGLAITALTWPRITAVFATGSIDDWIAVATLAGGLIAVWLAGTFGVRRPFLRSQTRAAETWRQFRKSRTALFGLGVLIALHLAMLLAPLIAPFDFADPVGPRAAVRLLPPSAEFLLGTDSGGRDILSRILYGARVSLTIGFVATAISIFLGTTIGAVAGYAGGRLDAALMRFTDLVLSFPRLVLLILVVALFGPSVTVLILVLGLTQWPTTTRIVRGDVLAIREREYIQAAHALGFGPVRTLARHVVPNVMGPVIVAATLGIGNTIVLEAGLSFLGLGPPPPMPTWGAMVENGRAVLVSSWWVSTFPGLAIVLVVLAFNLVGDGLRDALDPRLR